MFAKKLKAKQCIHLVQKKEKQQDRRLSNAYIFSKKEKQQQNKYKQEKQFSPWVNNNMESSTWVLSSEHTVVLIKKSPSIHCWISI
jgi:hypothetical protein